MFALGDKEQRGQSCTWPIFASWGLPAAGLPAVPLATQRLLQR